MKEREKNKEKEKEKKRSKGKKKKNIKYLDKQFQFKYIETNLLISIFSTRLLHFLFATRKIYIFSFGAIFMCVCVFKFDQRLCKILSKVFFLKNMYFDYKSKKNYVILNTYIF